MRERAGGLVVAVAVVLCVAACNGGDESEAGPTATVPPAPSSTTTTNPYAVPEVIDAAYVNRVLAGLDAAVGDIVRLVVRTRDIPPEVIDRLKAVYQEREDINLELQAFSDDLRQSLPGYREIPGNQRSAVLDLLAADSGCVFARIERDYAELRSNPAGALSIEWIGLRRAPSDPNILRYNPTPWQIAVAGVRSDGSAPANPCRPS